MKITVLVENTTSCAVGAAHGLSLFVEACGKKILFDAGPEGSLLLKNADTLGIDLASADLAVLSHGHYDHSGGFSAFLAVNDRAPVYLHRSAAYPHFASEANGFRYIGIASELQTVFGDRLVYTDDFCQVNDDLTLFSDVKSAELLSGSNSFLFEIIGDSYQPDRFFHEQNLLIRENEKLFLIGGCAHRGIINIIRRTGQISGRMPDAVFAGFHLTNPGIGIDEPSDFVRSIGEVLAGFPCRYYTGHCTGSGPYGILSEILGERLRYLHGGSVFEV